MKAHLHLLQTALCIWATTASAEPSVSQRKIADLAYELSVTVPGITDVSEAQKLLVPYAEKPAASEYLSPR